MCSKLTRFSRISFSYMNMTMSLSSAWIAGDAARRRDDLQRLPDVAVLHHAADVARPDVGGEDLDAGMAVLHRIGELAEMRHRHLAHQREMEAVVAVAGALPLRLRSARSTAGSVRSCAHCTKSISVVVPPCSAALLTCDGGSVSTSGRPGRADRHQAMDMRIDAAGDDQPVLGRHGARRVRQRARPADQRDACRPSTPISAAWVPRRQHAGAAGDGEVEHQVTPAGVSMATPVRRRRSGAGSRPARDRAR